MMTAISRCVPTMLALLIGLSGFAAEKADPVTPTFPAPAPNKQQPITLLQVPEMNPFRPYDRPGIEGIAGKATGMFHTEKIKGRDWLIDPNGKGALIIGGNGLCTPSGVPIFTPSFTDPKSPEHAKVAQAHIDAYAAVVGKYGSIPEYFEGMRAMGDDLGLTVNATMHLDPVVGSQPIIRQLPLSYAFWNWQWYDGNPTTLGYYGDGGGYERPDVFNPGWEAHCDEIARAYCGPFKGSPWVIGYYLENEIRWGDVNSAAIAAWIAKDYQPAKHEFIRQAEQRFKTIAAFNSAFDTTYTAFSDISQATTAGMPNGPEGFAFFAAFSESYYDRFYRVATEAIHRHAPGHLILGTREISVRGRKTANPVLWKVMGKYCDLVSFNMYYNIDPVRGADQALINTWAELAQLSGKPLINTEWTVFGRDSGCTVRPENDQIVDTQAQRADAYQAGIEAYFSQPWAVGNSWFCPNDPVGATTNYGVFRADGTPWQELYDRMKQVNPTLGAIHAGRKKPRNPIWAQEAQKPWKPTLPTTTIASDGPITVGDLKVTIDRGWAAIDWKGTRLGSFFPYTTQQRFDDGYRWSWPTSCTVVNAAADAAYTVLELEFKVAPDTPADAGGGQPPKPGTWNGGGWTAHYQLWIPASGAWFASRHLWTENTGDRAWILPGISHSMTPNIGGSFDNNVLAQWEKRAEWEESWINRTLGVGLTAQAPSGRFSLVGWMQGPTDPKSDYTEISQLDRLLKPGERWTNPDSPPCFHAGFIFDKAGPHPYAEIRAATDQFLRSYK